MVLSLACARFWAMDDWRIDCKTSSLFPSILEPKLVANLYIPLAYKWILWGIRMSVGAFRATSDGAKARVFLLSCLTSCKYDYIYMWLPYWNEAHGSPPNSYGKIIVVKVYMSVYPRKTFIQAVGFGDYASWGHQGEIPLRCLDALSAKYPSTTTDIRYNLGVLSAI